MCCTVAVFTVESVPPQKALLPRYTYVAYFLGLITQFLSFLVLCLVRNRHVVLLVSKSRKRTSVTDVRKCNTAHLRFKEDLVRVASKLGCFQKQIQLDLLHWRENRWKLLPCTSKSCPPRGFWPAWCWRPIGKVMFCDFIRKTEF